MLDKTGTEGNGAPAMSAPYVAFQSIKTLAKDLKAHGVPSRIDRSVLGNFSGSVGKQIVTALRFLGLTDANNHSTGELDGLVSAYDTPAWSATLTEVIRAAYAPMFQLNLETATPSQFNEKFRKVYPGAEAVMRKQSTFFLNAVREAGITISPYIMKNKKPRTGPTKKRAANPNDPSQQQNRTGGKLADPPPPPPADRKLSEQLLAVLDDAELDDKIKDAVLTLLPHLRQKGK